MAQKPVLRGEVRCACVARDVSVERRSRGWAVSFRTSGAPDDDVLFMARAALRGEGRSTNSTTVLFSKAPPLSLVQCGFGFAFAGSSSCVAAAASRTLPCAKWHRGAGRCSSEPTSVSRRNTPARSHTHTRTQSYRKCPPSVRAYAPILSSKSHPRAPPPDPRLNRGPCSSLPGV